MLVVVMKQAMAPKNRNYHQVLIAITECCLFPLTTTTVKSLKELGDPGARLRGESQLQTNEFPVQTLSTAQLKCNYSAVTGWKLSSDFYNWLKESLLKLLSFRQRDVHSFSKSLVILCKL